MNRPTVQQTLMLTVPFLLILQLTLLISVPLGYGQNEKPELTRLSLQLKWYHQFQFAGFYAAQQKGFYREEGLEMTLLEGGPDCNILKNVLSGKADFGLLGPNLLLSRLQGNPLVALAVIVQHSPAILLSKKEKGIRIPTDLIGKPIGTYKDNGEVELKALFHSEGITLNNQQLVSGATLQDLLDDKIAAISAYLSNEPHLLAEQGIAASIIRPISYDIDCYGDMLFTTEKEVKKYPKRSAAFLRASLKGWNYAFSHQEELIEYILTLPGVLERGGSRQRLQYEAEQLKHLIHPELIEIGHVNPQRIQQMANSFVALGMVASTAYLKGFVYKPNQTLKRYFKGGLAAITLLTILLMPMLVIIGRQRLMVRRKTAALLEQQQRYRNIFESVPASIVLVDENGRIVDINPHHLQSICKGKASRNDYLGRDILNYPSVVEAGRAALYQRVLAGEQMEETAAYFPMLTGGCDGYLNIRGVPLFTPEQEVCGAVFFHEDISQLVEARKTIKNQHDRLEKEVAERTLELQKKNDALQQEITHRTMVEQAARETKERFRALSEASFEAIFFSEKGVCLEQNRTAEKMFGYTLTEAIGRKATEWIAPAERNKIKQKIRSMTLTPYQSIALRKDGSTFPCEIQGKMVSYRGKKVRVTALRDISQQREAEEALLKSHNEVARKEELLQSIFRSAPVGIGLILNRKLHWTNEKLSEITGYSRAELRGQNIRMLYADDVEFQRVGEKLYNSIKQHGTGSLDTLWQRKDGTRLDVSLTATISDMAHSPDGITFTALDVTLRNQAVRELADHKAELEQRIAERTEALERTYQQLIHAEKLSAIGRLSASIAHEFNNPLNGIQSVLEGVQNSSKLGQEDIKMVGLALVECERVRKLIRNLLDFNAPSHDQREPCDLHEALEEILSMYAKELRSCSIRLRKEYLDELPLIQVIPDQIKQVLLNLITNAKDAMQEKGGLLTIRTERKGQQVVVHISDTGTGISQENLEQIFEPFFTTKSAIKGTGLGLSVSYGIIKNHGGKIEVESVLGKGTTFSLSLSI